MRDAADNFLHKDAHDGPMPLDFYFWVIKDQQHTILVDTGFSGCSARERNRQLLHEPIDLLASLGIEPEDIEHIVLTHLHYDHAGNVASFPNATIHLQEAEMHFATGKWMCFEHFRHFFSADDITQVIRKVYTDKVQFHNGNATLLAGIELIHIGGHTPGLQAVRVNTRRGPIMLASDAMHYYRNFATDNPFPAIVDVTEMLQGYRKLRSLVPSDNHLIPGHDPLVADIYPCLETHSSIFRLDISPG
ncbi:N-acyl homoserine lactonase family protein [Advenella mimigardefordensis]